MRKLRHSVAKKVAQGLMTTKDKTTNFGLYIMKVNVVSNMPCVSGEKKKDTKEFKVKYMETKRERGNYKTIT